jgi:hypothetical protein
MNKPRTLYLDDQAWDRLRELAFRQRVTISEVVRQSIGPAEPINQFRAPLDKVTTPGERPVMENRVVSAEPVIHPASEGPQTVKKTPADNKLARIKVEQAKRDEWLRKMSKEGK